MQKNIHLKENSVKTDPITVSSIGVLKFFYCCGVLCCSVSSCVKWYIIICHISPKIASRVKTMQAEKTHLMPHNISLCLGRVFLTEIYDLQSLKIFAIWLLQKKSLLTSDLNQ